MKGHAVAAFQIGGKMVQIQPGIGLGQGILVEIQQHQAPFALGPDLTVTVAGDTGGHFQHTFPAGNILIPGQNEIHFSITYFQLTEALLDEHIAQTHISHQIFLLRICRFCRGF